MAILALGCADKKSDTRFTRLDSKETGIDFKNQLRYDEDFNVYTYRNYYNGGGVSIGDINNDGLVDIYFTSNLDQNKLYLNKGNFQFEDISEKAGVSGDKAWSTGVTMADINGDGWLDIYVCNSGDVQRDNKQNELFINNGNLTFSESAERYGLADKGFSTHASFFDYDKDGDLDVYLLNNSYQAIGSFNLQRNERPKRDQLGGDKLMRNDNGTFTDVSELAGIYGSIIGFGLGVTIGDVNGDAWDDIYVSNDFFERDYLYVNQGDGTFNETLTDQMKSISGASMGADMADVNNDGYNDLFVTEMLPSDYKRLKSVTTFEDWDRYQYGVKNGYFHQFTRNTFQLNNGDSTFSEIGRLAGVEASDWSWGALFFDMDNDGLRDIFIANGIYQDLTNQDYLQYISNEEVLKSIVSKNKVDYKKLIDLIPSNAIPNHAYLNQGDLRFEEVVTEFGLDEPGFSNGAAYGDLDNDGDLDLVINNVNMEAWVYRNNTMETEQKHYIKFVLNGNGENTFAIGSKISVSQGENNYYIEQQPIRGFQSSVDPRPNLGLPSGNPIKVEVIWPSGQVSKLENVSVDQILGIKETDSSSNLPPEYKKSEASIFLKVIDSINYKHVENEYVDFNRDRLLYHMNSTEGPKMSTGDMDGDGNTDIFIGGSKDSPAQILKSNGSGFVAMVPAVFEGSSISEDAASVFFDADADGDLDLYVCSGGVEFSQSSSALKDRLYINLGAGEFELSSQFLPTKSGYVSTSTVSKSDVDGDGDIDLFVGERIKPFQYGVPGNGFLLINNGKGTFESSTPLAFDKIGMITASKFADMDSDGDEDLVVVGEFMGIKVFENTNGQFQEKNNEGSLIKGWWKSLEIADLDGDGDNDVIVGNHGLNNRFSASETEPIRLYLNDYDGNGSLDPILTGFVGGREFPFALRHNLIDQIKSLKKRFPDYESFKEASIDQIFTEEELVSATVLETNELKTIVLINNGDYSFSRLDLPVTVQMSPIYTILAGDYDQDGDQDILLGGNLYGAKPEVGRYDASYGVYLENDGAAHFKVVRGGKGFRADGELRDIVCFDNKVIVSRNNDSLLQFTIK